VDSALWEPGSVVNWDADPSDIAKYPNSLIGALRRHVQNARVFRCPAAIRGYPQALPLVTYRSASADNYNGNLEEIFDAKGRPKYVYSLKYLDGRKHEIRHVDLSTPPIKLRPGPGPYYLMRDFGDQDAQGTPILPHQDGYNQLYVDMHVEHISEPDSPIVF
jgi:hypothetical protein